MAGRGSLLLPLLFLGSAIVTLKTCFQPAFSGVAAPERSVSRVALQAETVAPTKKVGKKTWFRPRTSREGDAPPQKKSTARYFVRLLKDDPLLGEVGDIVKVRRGRYRNELFPQGIAEMIEGNPEVEQRKKKAAEKLVAEEKMQEAIASKAKIEEGKYVFEKKVRSGTTKIYGSLTPLQVVEEIKAQTGETVRATSVSVPKIVETGKYSCTIEVGKNVNAYLEVEIIAEGTRGDGDDDEEGEGEGED
mmetsp:Transcript_39319/g.71556  ORF Transcript_39319/g.71556 Transcript_39319/m.71556 type:complete len:247 (+) Transcript_39319:90-830(+)